MIFENRTHRLKDGKLYDRIGARLENWLVGATVICMIAFESVTGSVVATLMFLVQENRAGRE